MEAGELKKLTAKYGADQLESCIRQQLEKGENACEVIDEDDTVFETLSKAGVIRDLMDQGMTFAEALRELGRRIRAVYGKE